MDDRFRGLPSGGRFVKQYYINFIDGAELHAWIFLTDECHLVYGHNYKSPDGENEIYTSAHERDFFELPDLDKRITIFLSTIAMQAKAMMRVIEVIAEVPVDEQLRAMKEAGFNTDDIIGFGKKYEELKLLDELWDRGVTNMSEDCSSIDWLIGCVHKWEEANKEKGRFVEFFGSFFALDPKDNFGVKEDRVFAFGLKKTILNTLKEISAEVKKEKEDFVNW